MSCFAFDHFSVSHRVPSLITLGDLQICGTFSKVSFCMYVGWWFAFGLFLSLDVQRYVDLGYQCLEDDGFIASETDKHKLKSQEIA